MLSDLQLVYMVPRNSTQLVKINTTKFQVEREPVYRSNIKDPTSLLVFFVLNMIKESICARKMIQIVDGQEVGYFLYLITSKSST